MTCSRIAVPCFKCSDKYSARLRICRADENGSVILLLQSQLYAYAQQRVQLKLRTLYRAG